MLPGASSPMLRGLLPKFHQRCFHIAGQPIGIVVLDRRNGNILWADSGILGSRPEGTSTLNFLETKQMEKRFPGLLASVLGNL
jgi:hypothetical protein